MDRFIKKKQVNKQKVYVSGLSMGGMGTLKYCIEGPNMFAAATPICGNGIAEFAKKYANKVSVWIFHGSDDKVVESKAFFKNGTGHHRIGWQPQSDFIRKCWS
jgi:predicted peptidase